jgi:hypothetical protein
MQRQSSRTFTSLEGIRNRTDWLTVLAEEVFGEVLGHNIRKAMISLRSLAMLSLTGVGYRTLDYSLNLPSRVPGPALP